MPTPRLDPGNEYRPLPVLWRPLNLPSYLEAENTLPLPEFRRRASSSLTQPPESSATIQGAPS
jgi:hypothetical protein